MAAAKHGMSSYLQARQQVLEACLTLAGRGFLAGTGGNVSLRVDERRIAITPSGVDYYAMKAGDVCILDVDSLAVESGDRKPSVEVGLHAALLRCRSDAAAVIHTHQPLASAVSLVGVDLPIDDPEMQQVLGPCIKAVSYAPSGTRLLVHSLSKRLSSKINAYLLCNHGLICCGPTLADAIAIAEHAERAARRFLRETIGRNVVSQLALETLEELR